MSENIQPLNDRIIVKRTDSEEKTKGGIVIPDSAKEKPSRGKVIAVGPGKFHAESGKRLPVEVKKGQLVLFGKYAGTEVKVGDEEWVVLREDDLIGVVE
jgi:chaperonin GroES